MAAARTALNRTVRRSPVSYMPRYALIVLLGLAPAVTAAAPALFKNVRPLAVQQDATAAGAAAPAQAGWQYALPQDVQVMTMAAPGGGTQPAAFEFMFDLEFLLTNPPAFTMNLPRIPGPVLVRLRADLDGLLNSVTASAGGGTPVPGQPSVVNSAAVVLKSARLWTGQVAIAPAGLSAVSFAASLDTWNIYAEIRWLENRSNKWRMFKIVPALTASQLAAMNAGGSQEHPLLPPPVEVKCVVFEYRRLPTTSSISRAAAITTEAAAAAPAVPLTPHATAATVTESSSSESGDEYAYTFREVHVPHSNSSSSSSGGSSRRQVLQSAANVARQDMLLVYTGAAAAQSFNDEYVRASMVNTLAITNKAYLDSRIPVVLYAKDIRQVLWQESGTPLQDVTVGVNGLEVVAPWRDELAADVVSFWYSSASQPQLCGEAWVGGDAPFAFSTIHMPCWSGYYFAGAVPRNQGCRSNFYASDYAPFADGMAGPYAFGLRRCGGASCSNIFTTISSNPCLCSKQQEPVGFFSNPNLRVRIGTTWQTIGNPTRADCARGITQTAVAVSSYR